MLDEALITTLTSLTFGLELIGKVWDTLSLEGSSGY